MAPPAKARAKLDAVGADWIIEQLADGRAKREIARELGVDVMSLYHYLDDNPLQSARAAAALEAGAEAHEQRAMQILEEARDEVRDNPSISGSIVALARERAQSHWRAAGVRSRRYQQNPGAAVHVTVNTGEVSLMPTAQLEMLVAQHSATLQLEADGSVTGGGASDSGEAGE